jgi:hypothetical protein
MPLSAMVIVNRRSVTHADTVMFVPSGEYMIALVSMFETLA